MYCPLMFLCLCKEIWQPIVDNNQDLPWSTKLMINSRVYHGEYSQSSTSEFEIFCLNIHMYEVFDIFRTILISVSKFLIVYGYYKSSTNSFYFVVMVPSLGGATEIPRWPSARKGCLLGSGFSLIRNVSHFMCCSSIHDCIRMSTISNGVRFSFHFNPRFSADGLLRMLGYRLYTRINVSNSDINRIFRKNFY